MQLKSLEQAHLADFLKGEKVKQLRVETPNASKHGKSTPVSASTSREGNSQQVLLTAVELDEASFPASKSLNALRPGLEIGPADHRFRLVRLISAGEISRLWLAQDLAPEHLTDESLYKTLKIFAPQLQEPARLQETSVRDDSKAARLELINLRALLAKLRMKAELAVKLNHPVIARVYGWRQGEDGWPFLEMEYADQRAGCSLDRLLKREGKPGLGLERTLKLLSPVAEALEYAHREHRLMHRALEPSNVFLSDQGAVKVLNFGLNYEMRETRDTAASVDMNALVSPDSSSDSQLTEQSRFKQDVNAFAALAYQLLTGVSPVNQATGVVEPATLAKPVELDETAWRALQQSLDYQNERCLGSAVELIQRLEVARSASGATRRRSSAFLLGLAAVLLLSIAVGWWYVQWSSKAAYPTAPQTASHTDGQPNPDVMQTDSAATAAEQQQFESIRDHRLAKVQTEHQQEEEAKRAIDDGSYAAAHKLATLSAYRIYLQHCVDCSHREAAQTAIKELEAKGNVTRLKSQFEARLKARELADSNLKGSGAIGLLAALEALAPQDPFIAEGKQRIALAYGELARESLARGAFAEARNWLANGLAVQPGQEMLSALSSEIDKAERKSQDDQAYAKAEQADTQPAYQDYLVRCAPTCGHRSEAESALERLKSVPPSMPGSVFRDRLTDGSVGPEMVVIASGSFTMGSPLEERGHFSDERQHPVQIQAFALGKFEVTFEEYDRFAEAAGRRKPDDKGWGRGRRPVINVNWNDATAYAHWLSAQTGQHYRLPTEAEWEYAARAGSQSARYWGDDPNQGCAYANGADLTGKSVFANWNAINCRDGYVYTAPVGSFKVNAFDLQDLLGNVLEWTCSAYDESYDGAEQRCETKERASRFVYRGGSWSDEPRSLRSADRLKEAPDFKDYFLGFRLVRQLQ